MTGLVGSNALIREMAGRQRAVVRTSTRVGEVYHFEDALKPIKGEVVERLIDKGILIPSRDSNRAYTLSPTWGGVAP